MYSFFLKKKENTIAKKKSCYAIYDILRDKMNSVT